MTVHAVTGASGTFGECRDCNRLHALPVGNAQAHALELIRQFQSIRRLDDRVPEEEADPRLCFENLFAEGRGSMFGVLECQDERGETVVLRAFSSLWQGIRQIDGWVLPILSAGVYEEMILPAQHEIKTMTARLAGLDRDSSAYARLERRRKAVSQALWQKMCASYRFRNFRGVERSLADAILPGSPITGGIGECCAPKLLDHAARNRLRPLGLSEFYWGDERPDRSPDKGRVGSRKPGEFYPSCEARCRPILGFMLCGLDE